jgi:hypothetical protein
MMTFSVWLASSRVGERMSTWHLRTHGSGMAVRKAETRPQGLQRPQIVLSQRGRGVHPLSRLDIDQLARGDRDERRFARSRLRLSDDVAPSDDGQDGPLLDRGRLLKAVGVQAPQQILLQAHLIKAVNDLDALGGLELSLLSLQGRSSGLPAQQAERGRSATQRRAIARMHNASSAHLRLMAGKQPRGRGRQRGLLWLCSLSSCRGGVSSGREGGRELLPLLEGLLDFRALGVGGAWIQAVLISSTATRQRGG